MIENFMIFFYPIKVDILHPIYATCENIPFQKTLQMKKAQPFYGAENH